jgi:hypothetical protein
MKKLVQISMALSLAVLIASPILAGEDNKKEAKDDKAKAERKAKIEKAKAEKGKAKEKKAPSVVRLPKSIELTAEQKEKVAAINKKYAGKIAEFRQQVAGLVTPEQRKARAEAIKAARDAGKTGAELKKAVADAGKPSDEQKAKAAELKKAASEVIKQAQAELKEVLTKEQLASLRSKKEAKPKAEKKKPEGAKKKADEAKKKPNAAKAEKK